MPIEDRALKGRLGEWLAAALLLAKGYRILRRRVRLPMGEIDLLAKRGKTLVLVEVKWRSSLEHAAYAITLKQRRRLQRTGEVLFAQYARYTNIDSLRFDVVLLAPLKVRHIQNTFLL